MIYCVSKLLCLIIITQFKSLKDQFFFNGFFSSIQSMARSSDLGALKRKHGDARGEGGGGLPATGLERSGVKRWEFGAIPESVTRSRGGIRLPGFPALVDRNDAVDLRVFDSAVAAQRAHRAGLRRLLMLNMTKDVRYLRRNLPGMSQLQLQYAKVAAAPQGWQVPAKQSLEDEATALIMDLVFLEGRPEIRDGEAFAHRLEQHRGDLMACAARVMGLLGEIVPRYRRIRKSLAAITQVNWMASATDIRQQLDALVYRGFLEHTPYARLEHLPRYLKAIELRLEKLAYAPARDRKLMAEMHEPYRRWQERESKYRLAGKHDARVEELRWQFEELRVSLFAQELGTAHPVSLQRIARRWRELGL